MSPEGRAEASEVLVPKAAQGAACVGIRGSAQTQRTVKSFLPTPAQIQRCAEARTERGQHVCFAWAVARDEVVAGNHASATAARSPPRRGGKASVSLPADHIFSTLHVPQGRQGLCGFLSPPRGGKLSCRIQSLLS